MKINYTETYGYEGKVKSGLGFDFYEQIVIEGNGSNEVMQRLSKEYEIYQYDDNVKYGEHDLFSWSDGSGRHFQLTVNDEKLNEKEIRTLENNIISVLEKEFVNGGMKAYFKKGYSIKPETVEQFLFDYELDLNNLQLEKFSVIQDPSVVSAVKISIEARKRLEEVNEQFLQLMEGKKAIVNNRLEGSFRRLSDRIVFFKKRARKNYYEIKLNKLSSLELI